MGFGDSYNNKRNNCWCLTCNNNHKPRGIHYGNMNFKGTEKLLQNQYIDNLKGIENEKINDSFTYSEIQNEQSDFVSTKKNSNNQTNLVLNDNYSKKFGPGPFTQFIVN